MAVGIGSCQTMQHMETDACDKEQGADSDADTDDAALAAGLFAMLGAPPHGEVRLKEVEQALQAPVVSGGAATSLDLPGVSSEQISAVDEEAPPWAWPEGEEDSSHEESVDRMGDEEPEEEMVHPQVEDEDADDGDDMFFVDTDGGEHVTRSDVAAKTRGVINGNVEELIPVPMDVAEDLIGQDGEGIRRLADDCGGDGLRLTFLAAGASGRGGSSSSSRPTRMLLAEGPPAAVAAVRRTLRNLAAEAVADAARNARGTKRRPRAIEEEPDGGAGGAKGVCKWFAAGFCRNRTATGSCRNGFHDGQAALAAEAAWLAAAPATGSIRPSKLPVLLLLDLEGGGNQAGRDGEDEIIEVPVLAMCPVTGDELGRFHRFARPGYWDREREAMRRRYPASCFNGMSSAVAFREVMSALQDWIGAKLLGGMLNNEDGSARHLRCEDFLFVTCGNWDVKTILPRQCNKPTAGTVDFGTQKLLLSRWCNMKEVFREHYKLSEAAAPTGMRGMLRRLQIPLSGQHHLGMDDVTNLAKILKTLILRRARIEATGYAVAATKPRTPHAPGAAAAPKAPVSETPRRATVPASAPNQAASPAQARVTAGAPAKPAVGTTSAASAASAVCASKSANAKNVCSEAAKAHQRSGKDILKKYSNTARAEELGQEVRVKRRLPGKSSSKAEVPAWGSSAPITGAIGKGKAVGRWLRGSPSILSSGKAAGKRR